MIVRDDRLSQRMKVGESSGNIIIGGAFHDAPPVILATRGGARLKIHFFKSLLPHIADVQIARRAIKGKPPRVAQAIRPDFRPRIGISSERICRWNTISFVAVFHIDSQNFSEERLQILRAVLRITVRTAIADADVKISIRPKSEMPAIMIILILQESHDHRFSPRHSVIRIKRNLEARDDNEIALGTIRVVRGGCVVSVEMLSGRKTRRKGKTEQTLFEAGADYFGGNIKKGFGQNFTVLDNPNASGSLRHKQSFRPIASVRNGCR